jgi:hypothetical protein
MVHAVTGFRFAITRTPRSSSLGTIRIWRQFDTLRYGSNRESLSIHKHDEFFLRQKALPNLIRGDRFGLNDRFCPLLIL